MLLVALISIVGIVGIKSVGSTVLVKFETTADKIAGADDLPQIPCSPSNPSFPLC